MGFSSFPVNCPLNQSIEPKKATRVRNCWACWACWLWLFGTIESQWNRMGGTRRIETSGDMTRFTSHKIDYDYIWLLANRWGQMAHQSQTNFGIILCPITLQPMTGARSIRLLPRGEIARGRQKEWTWRPWNQDQEHECEPKIRQDMSIPSLVVSTHTMRLFDDVVLASSVGDANQITNEFWVALPCQTSFRHKDTRQLLVYIREVIQHTLFTQQWRCMSCISGTSMSTYCTHTYILYIYTIHIQISIYLSVYLSIYLNLSLSIYLSIDRSNSHDLSIYLPIYYLSI